MGQYWKLFNLDKLECVYYMGSAKFGEFFYSAAEDFQLNLLLSGQLGHNSWGGDRIILLGDDSADLPSNTVTNDDPSALKACVATDQSESRHHGICAYRTLSDCCKEVNTIPEASFNLPADTVYILRSLTRKEYVRRDVVENYRQYSRRENPGLSQALFTLVGWSENPSAALAYNTEGYIPASGGTIAPLHRGAWAGNRIDIVPLTDEVQKIFDEEGWSNVSEEKARHVSDVYACDGF